MKEKKMKREREITDNDLMMVVERGNWMDCFDSDSDSVCVCVCVCMIEGRQSFCVCCAFSSLFFRFS